MRSIFVGAVTCTLTRNTNPRIHVRFIPLEGGLHGDSHSSLDDFLRVMPMDHPGVSSGPLSGEMDKMLVSILNEIDGLSTPKDLMPMMRLHARDRFGANHPCKRDADKLCGKEEASSLHCLGQHASQLSPQCVQAIEKSIPFVCAVEISMFCPAAKIMQTSLLQCLEKEAAEHAPHADRIAERCKDSIISTRSIVNKLKYSKPHLVDALTGEILTAYNSGKSFVVTVVTALVYGSLAVAVIVAIALCFWKDQTVAAIKTTAKHGRQVLVSKQDQELCDNKKRDLQFYDAALI